MSDFIPGLRLAEIFYRDAVAPILVDHFPDLAYSAALIGSGSDVLGFDTARSMDHEWGPRLQLFLSEADALRLGPVIHELLRHELPSEVAGISTHFAEGDEAGIRHLRPHTGGPVEHKVVIETVTQYLRDGYGLPGYRNLSAVDWLTTTDQGLLELTKGAIFHDGLEELRPMQAALSYHPDQIWRYRLAAQWARIGEMVAFVGRTAEVGDEVGSRLTAALLVRDVMRLAFLMERQYTPYAKWFGTGFSRLACAPELGPHLERAMAAQSFADREAGLADAYRVVTRMHNDLRITPPLPTEPVHYFGRPFLVIFAGEFAAAIKATITDPAVLALPNEAGGIDQFSDSTAVLEHHRDRLRAFYSGQP